ncbi:MAG: MOSC domain-containing protein [Campylobacter sp.]|nr:MOSC domain-containing protein [Campylobacter sp.]
MATLKALLIGEVKNYGSQSATNKLNTPWSSAIFKVAQNGEIFANELGFEGDSVADTKHHGGPEKAVFANSFANYADWESFLGLKNMAYGAMGENLCVDGLDESCVYVGDIHKIGSLVLQVSQPRKPCFKLSKRWGNENMATHIFETGLTGWYYRVITPGSCKVGDVIEVIEKDPVHMSILEVNRLFCAPNKNLNLLEKFNSLTTLPKSWYSDMERRIQGIYSTEYMRNL